MSPFNWTAILISSLLPLLVGAIWYVPALEKLFVGSAPEKRKHPMMSYILCVILSIPIASFVSILMSAHPASDVSISHGIFHGVILAAFTIAPAFIVHFYFEGKSLRYSFYHVIYWIISGGAIGAVVAYFFLA